LSILFLPGQSASLLYLSCHPPAFRHPLNLLLPAATSLRLLQGDYFLQIPATIFVAAMTTITPHMSTACGVVPTARHTSIITIASNNL
jgi:hypothetical protein